MHKELESVRMELMEESGRGGSLSRVIAIEIKLKALVYGLP